MNMFCAEKHSRGFALLDADWGPHFKIIPYLLKFDWSLVSDHCFACLTNPYFWSNSLLICSMGIGASESCRLPLYFVPHKKNWYDCVAISDEASKPEIEITNRCITEQDSRNNLPYSLTITIRLMRGYRFKRDFSLSNKISLLLRLP